jgi:anti-anti-sigma regulatory factor
MDASDLPARPARSLGAAGDLPMQVFLSWSGAESKRAADALGPWLEEVCPGARVWTSTHDIQAGAPWGTALHEQLKRTDFGVLCLTAQNLTAPWILYEAGALATSSKVGCVVPFLLDVGPEKLPSPLSQFQSVPADREGAWKVVWSIHAASGGAATEEAVRAAFERAWPELARRLGLDVRARSQGGVLVVTPNRSQLAGDEAVNLLGERLKALVHGGHKKLVFDLSEVSTIGSVGMSLLFRVTTFWKGLEVVLVNAQPKILQLLELTHALRLLKHFPSLEEAVAYLNRPGGPEQARPSGADAGAAGGQS